MGPSASSTPPSRADRPPSAPLALSFAGSGSEYLRLWIVNLLLTLVTFGVYSAWAKVRREKFFHQNTRLADAGFDYHGRPMVILRGRIVAVALLALAQLDVVPPAVRGVATLLLLAILPWLMQRSLRFRLANTSYRGVRFAFAGSAWGAYRLFGGYFLAAAAAAAGAAAVVALAPDAVGVKRLGALLSLVVAAALLLMVPMLLASWRRYVVNHIRFGSESFSVTLRRREFVWIYLKAALLWGAVGVAVAAVVALSGTAGAMLTSGADEGVLSQGLLFVAGLVLYASAAAVGPTIGAQVQNLAWNRTRIGPHRMTSHLRTGAFVRLSLLNLVLTLATLGLYRPFAAVAVARMRIGALALEPAGSLDEIVASIDAHRELAIGSETVDLLGFDLSL